MEELWAKPSQEEIREPFAMERRRGSSVESRVFSSFKPGGPPVEDFSIPRECPIAATHRKIPATKLDRI